MDKIEAENAQLKAEVEQLREIAKEAWRLASYHNDEATEEFAESHLQDNPWLEGE